MQVTFTEHAEHKSPQTKAERHSHRAAQRREIYRQRERQWRKESFAKMGLWERFTSMTFGDLFRSLRG